MIQKLDHTCWNRRDWRESRSRLTCL